MTTPRLLDQVRAAIRVRHYSRRTEDTYVHWIRRFILFHAKRHPRDMGEREITAFLTYLAVDKNVAASTQNQTLSAHLFLYQKVLEMSLACSTTWSGRVGPNGCRLYCPGKRSRACLASCRVCRN